MYVPDLIKHRVIVETDAGEIVGFLIHLSRVVVIISGNVPVIVREWNLVKWI